MKAQKKTKYPINSNSSPEPFVMDQLEIMLFEIEMPLFRTLIFIVKIQRRFDLTHLLF